jgi:hypothetical protein
MASCWICLDDGPDQYGKPPVRDYSCRGDDAGFAHVSCIVDYARRKSSKASNQDDFDPDDFIVPWNACENCKKSYQNQLSIDLLDECKQFTDEQYPECSWRHLAVQFGMIRTVVSGAQKSRKRQEEIIETSLSMIDHLSMQSDRTTHEGCMILDLGSGILGMIGQFRLYQENITEDEAKEGLRYLDESRKMSESIGKVEAIIASEVTIARFKASCIERFGAQEAFGEPQTKEQLLHMQRNAYHARLEKYGEYLTLTNGTELAFSLKEAYHTIEAWRLMKRLISLSKQHHGQDHSCTKGLERLLSISRIQLVRLRSLGLEFEAIGYEDDKYVVRGPIGVPEESITTLTVDPADVILGSNGIPVVCHGLKNNAAYLNGKIGDIRSFDESTGRYGVYFEDEAIKPKCVKPRNLRILFELPDN